MKIVNIMLCSIFAFCFAACVSQKMSVEQKNAQRQKIAEMVESGSFIIEADYVQPLRGRQHYITPGYTLELRADSAFAYLPYFGVSRMAVDYGGSDGGMKFEEPMIDYYQSATKRGDGWQISFKIQNVPKSCMVYIDVYENGDANISINSQNRDAISYSGKIIFKED